MMVFANKKSGIVHASLCPFLPSEGNSELFESLHHALREEYTECTYCYGNGDHWKREGGCFQCEVDCNFWDNDCDLLLWDEEKPYCKKKLPKGAT